MMKDKNKLRKDSVRDLTDRIDDLEFDALGRRVGRIESDSGAAADTSIKDNTLNLNNSNPRWITAIVVAILGVVGYLIYVGGWATHKGDADPPANLKRNIGDSIE